MRVDAEWQARQVAMAEASVRLSHIWVDSDLSVLEWLTVLADEQHSVLHRHRNATEVNPIAGRLYCDECTIDEDPAPWCDCQPGETCKGPCRNRAHSPRSCPRAPKPGDPPPATAGS